MNQNLSFAFKNSMISFKQMLIQITKDAMLFVACFAPFLAGAFFQFGIPVIEKLLCSYFAKEAIITPYYVLLDLMLSMLAPTMFAFVGALVMLGEIDDKIAGYMELTPVGIKGYLLSRLGYPVIISFILNIIVVKSFGLSGIPIIQIVIISLFTSLIGINVALLIIAISTNKVEGMAMGKLSGIMLLGLLVPYVFKTKVQFFAGIFPSFWLGKYMITEKGCYLVIALLINVIWSKMLYKKYKMKVI